MHGRYILYIDVVKTGLLCCGTAVTQGSKLGFQRNVLAAQVLWGSVWCVPASLHQTRDLQKFSKEH